MAPDEDVDEDTSLSPPAEVNRANDLAFTEIWRRYGDEMHRRCIAWMGGNHADADEAWSRASFTVYRKLPDHIHRVRNLRAWLVRLTYNVCMDLHRENKRRPRERIDTLTEAAYDTPMATFVADDPEQSCLHKELLESVRIWVDELPERLRSTLLVYLSCSSYKQVAYQLSIKEPNARKRMQEARALLRLRLLEYRSNERSQVSADGRISSEYSETLHRTRP